MPLKKYPVLDEESPVPDVKTFRLSCISQIQRELEQDLSKYNKTKRRYSYAFNNLTYINTGAATIGSLGSATSIGLLASGVGTLAAVPLGAIALGFGLCSLALSTANKKIKKKLQKHTAIVQLITAKLSSFRLIISKALADSNITDEEFQRLQADYDDYKRQKFDLQKKMTFAQPQDTETIKKECLKKVNETLNSILEK